MLDIGLDGDFDDKYHHMANKPLDFITVSENKEYLTFSFQDGTNAIFRAVGDCCSSTWIEHLELPLDVSGKVLLSVEEKDLDTFVEDYETIQIYQTRFVLSSGETISIEYRNSSNGYYGGWLERV